MAAALNEQSAASFISCKPVTGDHDGNSPFTIASVLAGAPLPAALICRRTAWTTLGGFDAAADRFEQRDFWIRGLARGLVGTAWPEAVVEVSSDAIARYAESVPTAEVCFLRHRTLMARHADDVLLEKERLLIAQRDRLLELHNRRTAAHSELDKVQREIVSVATELHAAGRNPVEFGDLRRTTPISPAWGLERGLPLDRYYITAFLDRHRTDVRGRVLEVKDPGYTREFGDDRVAVSDVVDIDRDNNRATMIADLTRPGELPENLYDCFILTQVLGLIYDVRAAVAGAYRVLKPGGVLLCTVPASGRISYEGTGVDGDYWRFTEASIRALFSEAFPLDAFEVTGFGNVLSNAAFLYGLAPHELTRAELDAVDPYFPVVYAIRAVKPRQTARAGRESRRAGIAGTILAYHRIDDDVTRPELCVSPANFRAHRRHLAANGFTVTSVREIADAARAGRVGERFVAVTFDDGYRGSSTCASGILAQHSFPATFFVVADALNEAHEFWWDLLARVFLSARPLPSELHLDLRGGLIHLSAATRVERYLSYRKAVEALYLLPRAERDQHVQHLAATAGAGSRSASDPGPMTSAELVRLAGAPGIEIGAHSSTHVWLPAETRETQLKEIAQSKWRLEVVIQRPVLSFSYPYGGYTPAAVDIVRQAGYEVAVTIERRPVMAGEDSFVLPRLEISNCDEGVFAERLRSLFDASSDPQSYAAWTPISTNR